MTEIKLKSRLVKSLLEIRNKIYVDYKNLPSDIKGEKILIDDGKIILKVIETNKKNKIIAEVIQGGRIIFKKGV